MSCIYCTISFIDDHYSRSEEDNAGLEISLLATLVASLEAIRMAFIVRERRCYRQSNETGWKTNDHELVVSNENNACMSQTVLASWPLFAYINEKLILPCRSYTTGILLYFDLKTKIKMIFLYNAHISTKRK